MSCQFKGFHGMTDQLKLYFTLATRFNKFGKDLPLVRTVSHHDLLELASVTNSQSLKSRIYQDYPTDLSETLPD